MSDCFVNSSKLLRYQNVTSSHQLHNFNIELLKKRSITTLSFFDEKLLVGDVRQLFTLRNGTSASKIQFHYFGDYFIHSAEWTHRGNIILTVTARSSSVLVMAEDGKIITTHPEITSPQSITVSNDGIIYIADYKVGVYQSTDDGVNWSLVFQSTEGWNYTMAIKVDVYNRDDYWTEVCKDKMCHLRIQSVDHKSSDKKMVWRDIHETIMDKKKIKSVDEGLEYFYFSHEIIYDGGVNIFLMDVLKKAIHVFLANGQYLCQLIPKRHFENEPISLALDTKRKVLYVGQWFGTIGAFKLTYEV